MRLAQDVQAPEYMVYPVAHWQADPDSAMWAAPSQELQTVAELQVRQPDRRELQVVQTPFLRA